MKPSTKTTLIAALSAALALGAANAYAADDNRLVSDTGVSKTWHYDKTAVTEEAALDVRATTRRVEDYPTLVVPLNTRTTIATKPAAELGSAPRFDTTIDMRSINLVDDETVFVGGTSDPDFDSLDAQRARAGYSNNLGVDPLTPVAGAGLATSF